MGKEDYYMELTNENGKVVAKGPKRTVLFFLNAIKQGWEHILELYDLDEVTTEKRIYKQIPDADVLLESIQVLDNFDPIDRDLEKELARILTRFVKFPETDEHHLMTVYMTDLFKRFSLNQEREDTCEERVNEYDSFRNSADYITVAYGLTSKPALILTRAEAEQLKKKFATGKRKMNLDDLTKRAKLFYESASAAADQVLTDDFMVLTKRDEIKWRQRERVNRKLARDYDKCLEILRTVNYQCFN
ncbi:MAG: hypothetical protein V3V78_03975 [Candidatus Woesearchaeota archaeon]